MNNTIQDCRFGFIDILKKITNIFVLMDKKENKKKNISTVV